MTTIQEIYSGMKAVFEENTGTVLTEGGDMAVRMYAAAAEIYALYIYNDWIHRQCFPQTAEGEYLDDHGQMRGITRTAASHAQGTLRFSIPEASASDVTVYADTTCMTAAGVYYDTREDGVIPAGSLSCDVPAQARVAGSVGNAAAGTIVYMTAAPIGVTACTNPAAFTGGDDEEDDAHLRARILASYKSLPNGANVAYYEKEVLNIDGVAAVRVLPKNRGLGTVDIIVAADGGVPDQTLLDKVQNRLDETREICVDIEVSGPETVTVNVAASIDVEDGYVFSEVKADVEAAVQGLFTGALLGQDVLIARLNAVIFAVNGVKNCQITAPTADASVGANQLAVLGTLTIQAWS